MNFLIQNLFGPKKFWTQDFWWPIFFTKTSSAGSATLGDTSWGRLIIQLGTGNKLKKTISGFILQAGICQIFYFAYNQRHSQLWQRGGALNRKNVYCKGGHRTYLLDEGNNWGGDTAQHWGGDTTHICPEWREQSGWGHCTTLIDKSKYPIPSL